MGLREKNPALVCALPGEGRGLITSSKTMRDAEGKSPRKQGFAKSVPERLGIINSRPLFPDAPSLLRVLPSNPKRVGYLVHYSQVLLSNVA